MCRPTDNRSSSSCSATCIRCRSPGAKRSGSPRDPRSTRSPATRPTARKSCSCPIARARKTSGCATPMGPTRARSRKATRACMPRPSGRRTATTSWHPRPACRSAAPTRSGCTTKDGGSGTSLTKEDKGPAPGPPGRGTANNALGAAFGPDPRYMWYARHRGGFGYNLSFPLWELAIYDRQTGKVFPQTDLYGSAMRPVLSPDGRWLVYATRHDAETGLRLRNLASGDEQWLVYPVQRDDQESRFTRDLMPGSSFTPDSKALVVSYGGRIWRVDVPSRQVSPIPFTAHMHQDLGPLVRFDTRVDTADILIKQIRDAAPSPDGRRLAFSALDKLYVMDLPGGAPRRLTSDSVHEQVPTWSPDGQWIAYVTWSDQGGYVQKIRADGRGKGQRLTPEPAFYDHPVWSPDGQ